MSRSIGGRTDHVVVVGAGLSGLAAALHLLGAGRRVTILDRGDEVGGRMGRMLTDGFAVDTGPTVLTMPELFDEALGAVGTSLAEHVTLHQLHPAYRARFADGSHLDVHTDADAMETELREKTDAATASGYRELRQWMTDLFDVEMGRFIGSSFDSPLDLLRTREARSDVARLVRLGGLGRLGPKVASLLPDERAQRLFSFQALYAGVSPSSALGAYGVIPYMDTVAGVFFPQGGMHAVARAMAAAATGAGAELRLGVEVSRLDHSGPNGRAAAVHTVDGERIACDAVVLTADLPLADAVLGRPHRRRIGTRWAPSCVVAHGSVPTAVAQAWPEPAHHTIDFGAAWDTTFDEIVAGGRPGRGRLMSDPSLLVTRPTHTDPSLAPEGQELCYVLAPCPNLESAPLDWERIGPAYVEEVLGVMESRGWTGIAESFRGLDVVTPSGWAAQGMAAGTPFSAAHTLTQTGPFRRGNLVPGVGNVVLAGSGTTPGVGVPTVLISGRLAAQRITG